MIFQESCHENWMKSCYYCTAVDKSRYVLLLRSFNGEEEHQEPACTAGEEL